MHGHLAFFGIGSQILHVVATAGFLFFLYNIAKSLKRIADHQDKPEEKPEEKPEPKPEEKPEAKPED